MIIILYSLSNPLPDSININTPLQILYNLSLFPIFSIVSFSKIRKILNRVEQKKGNVFSSSYSVFFHQIFRGKLWIFQWINFIGYRFQDDDWKECFLHLPRHRKCRWNENCFTLQLILSSDMRHTWCVLKWNDVALHFKLLVIKYSLQNWYPKS